MDWVQPTFERTCGKILKGFECRLAEKPHPSAAGMRDKRDGHAGKPRTECSRHAVKSRTECSRHAVKSRTRCNQDGI